MNVQSNPETNKQEASGSDALDREAQQQDCPEPGDPEFGGASVSRAGWIAASLVAVVLLAAALRSTAQSLQSEPLADLSTALLFTPCSLAAVTLGWRTWSAFPWISLLGIILCLAVAFPSRMLIAVPQLFSATNLDGFEARYWWQITLLHWCLFILAASIVFRVVQWLTGIGLWPTSPRERELRTAPKKLTVGRILLLLMLFSIAAWVYQALVRAWYPYLAQSAVSPQAMAAWYQWFPVGAMPWANGLIGGLLLPIHWWVIARALEFAKSDRPKVPVVGVMMLIGWVFVAGGLRLVTTKLYFTHRVLFAEAENANGIIGDWIEWTLGIPVNFFVYQANHGPAFSHQVVQGAIQVVLTILSITWLQWIGYRVGRYEQGD